jgi:hypothetical protein
MPDMIPLGWFHTILGIGAVVSGFYTLKLYVLLTLIVAGTALGIYNQGGFGIAHKLAVLTLVALAGGVVMEKTRLFGSFSKYCQAIGYSSTLLFHMIPAITDFLRRLPVGDPFIDTLEDPLLRQFHLAFLAIFAVGIVAQLLWLRKSSGP